MLSQVSIVDIEGADENLFADLGGGEGLTVGAVALDAKPYAALKNRRLRSKLICLR